MEESREKTRSVELVFQQLCLSLRVSFSFASPVLDIGAGSGLGEREEAATAPLLRWEHLEKKTWLCASVLSPCLLFQTIWHLSGSLEVCLPDAVALSASFRGPFAPSPAVGRTHMPGPDRSGWLCTSTWRGVPFTNAKSCSADSPSQPGCWWLKFHSEWNIYLLPHTGFLVRLASYSETSLHLLFWRWKIVTYCKKCLPHWRCW